MPQEQWIKTKGTHEPLKTEKEHGKIMARLALAKKVNPKARIEVLPLSGMLYCDKCGARMIIKTVVYKNGKKAWCALCSNRSENKSCDQRSTVLNEDFFDGLYEQVVHIEENLQYQFMENSNDLLKYRQLLGIKEKELKKHQQAIDRLYEMREEDCIDKATFLERENSREEQVRTLKQEIEDLKLIIQEQSDLPSMESSAKECDNRTPESTELLKLRKENQKLKMENDILKQAALILAQK